MPDTTPVLVPRMNTNDDQAVLVRWHVQAGTRVEADQLLVTLETTKAAFDVNAPHAGYVFFELAAKSMVDVGAAIAWISSDAAPPKPRAAPVGDGAAGAVLSAEGRFSRKALRLMKDHGLTADDFAGSARVEATNVETLIAARAGAAPLAPASSAGSLTEPLEQSASKMLEATMLERVYRSIVPSTVVVSVDEARLQARLKAVAAQLGPVSVLELAMQETAMLLADFPDLNGYYANGHAFTYHNVSIGFAINAGHCLKVPVVRNCNTAAPLELARAVRDLSLRYMREELTNADLSGGTFTVTDLSGNAVVHFIPVLNERQSAILGICAPRPGTATRELVLTFDHRISDGMRAATFLGALRASLEA